METKNWNHKKQFSTKMQFNNCLFISLLALKLCLGCRLLRWHHNLNCRFVKSKPLLCYRKQPLNLAFAKIILNNDLKIVGLFV